MPNYDTRVYVGDGLGGVSGVVTALPGGFVLGEERWENGIKYVLCYNAGNSQAVPGKLLSPYGVAGGGAYSVTVTMATGVLSKYGAVAVHNATATTGTHFWGVKQGYLASGLISSGTTLQTGYAVLMGTDGNAEGLSNVMSAQTVGLAQAVIGFVVNGPSAGTTTVRQGSVYVNFS